MKPLMKAVDTELESLNNCIVKLVAENRRLVDWVVDLQSGLYVNCVYCGHRYGPGETTPTSMADVLKEHIGTCTEHPLSAALARIAELESSL